MRGSRIIPGGSEMEECKDGWERLSGLVSNLSISLLALLLFLLIAAYFMANALGNAQITVPVQGKEVKVNFPPIYLPLDFWMLKNAVLALFVAVILGLPVPVISERIKGIKVGLSVIQTGLFAYALYSIVESILNFIAMFS